MSCGYQGHVCSSWEVQFISRYRDESDYCVFGERVTLYDNGTFKGIIPQEQKTALYLYLLNEYANYCKFHAVSIRPAVSEQELVKFGLELKPFEFPNLDKGVSLL